MPATPRCRCSTLGAPAPGDYALMCATTGCSPAPIPAAAAYFYSPDRRVERPEAHLASRAGADAGRRLCRLRSALRGRPPGRSDRRGRMLILCLRHTSTVDAPASCSRRSPDDLLFREPCLLHLPSTPRRRNPPILEGTHALRSGAVKFTHRTFDECALTKQRARS